MEFVPQEREIDQSVIEENLENLLEPADWEALNEKASRMRAEL